MLLPAFVKSFCYISFRFQFLDLAAKLDVELTVEAQRLIHGYYLASRRVRSAESMGGLMPKTAIETLYEIHSI